MACAIRGAQIIGLTFVVPSLTSLSAVSRSGLLHAPFCLAKMTLRCHPHAEARHGVFGPAT